jgi:hypothetical protein
MTGKWLQWGVLDRASRQLLTAYVRDCLGETHRHREGLDVLRGLNVIAKVPAFCVA